MSKTVFVSGCFDMLHSGHIAFLEEAASYGDLHVALGSDSTVYQLKGRLPVNTEQERLYMMQSLTCVQIGVHFQRIGHTRFCDRTAGVKT